jgi:hypothetical protein
MLSFPKRARTRAHSNGAHAEQIVPDIKIDHVGNITDGHDMPFGDGRDLVFEGVVKSEARVLLSLKEDAEDPSFQMQIEIPCGLSRLELGIQDGMDVQYRVVYEPDHAEIAWSQAHSESPFLQLTNRRIWNDPEQAGKKFRGFRFGKNTPTGGGEGGGKVGGR